MRGFVDPRWSDTWRRACTDGGTRELITVKNHPCVGKSKNHAGRRPGGRSRSRLRGAARAGDSCRLFATRETWVALSEVAVRARGRFLPPTRTPARARRSTVNRCVTVERDAGARFRIAMGRGVSWTVVGDATMEMERGDARAVDVNVFEILVSFARGSRRARGVFDGWMSPSWDGCKDLETDPA